MEEETATDIKPPKERPDWKITVSPEFLISCNLDFKILDEILQSTHSFLRRSKDMTSDHYIYEGWYGPNRKRAAEVIRPLMEALIKWRDGYDGQQPRAKDGGKT